LHTPQPAIRSLEDWITVLRHDDLVPAGSSRTR